MALKILHTADWHLGRAFPSFTEEDQTKLTRARIDAVDRLLGLAESYAVNAVLCAGDLFDEPAPSETWWRGLVRLFERRNWRDRPVFLLPGNHDPLQPESVWAEDHGFRRALPSWVHVIDRDDFEFAFSDEAVLYGIPCRSQAGADDPALRLPRRDPSDRRIRIGLVHGATFDVAGHQTNFPIAPDAAEQRGLTYLALGDTHAFREIAPKTCPAVYPGAPEATAFDEKDSGFVAVVFFPRHGRPPMIQKHAIARWRWRDETCRSLEELESLCTQDLKDCVLRLTLKMDVTVKQMDRVEAILVELKGNEAAHGRAGVVLLDRTGLELNTADTSIFDTDLPEVLRSVAARLQARTQGPDGEVAKRALYHLYRTVQETRL
ncbi:MAG TPA: DNA repair exonuclease [Bryobacteraceae bacterium]|nr:DNA repair exonuclease [Bryobacteraceae bacterium]